MRGHPVLCYLAPGLDFSGSQHLPDSLPNSCWEARLLSKAQGHSLEGVVHCLYIMSDKV